MTRPKKSSFKDKLIGVLMGGVSREREVSLKTGSAVVTALKAAGYRAVAIDAGEDLCARLKRRGAGAAFIALHGRLGEDGSVQGALEVMGLPYTGSGVLASAMAMDKVTAKKIFTYHGIPSPRFVVPGGRPGVRALKLPLIVKPAGEGSTIGVTVVKRRSEIEGAVARAKKYSGRVLVEEFVEGRELTVAVLDGEVFPVVEIIPKKGFYSFKAKYTRGETEFAVPAPLKKAVEKRVRKAAIDSYGALGCSGAARVDIVLDDRERPFVLEVNTVPGLTETSLFPMAAAASGLDYRGLVVRMLEGASLNKF
ncbi:MAG: D-alanine--D-alanine ligase [Thermodesulfobacteriota bacterium]|nr:MAG: D-alanine--D-alanine ligase [Thermodesulfobacteriota bacterium]